MHICQESGKPMFPSLAGGCVLWCFIAAGSSWQSSWFWMGVSWFCTGGYIYIESNKMLPKAKLEELFLFSCVLGETVMGS